MSVVRVNFSAPNLMNICIDRNSSGGAGGRLYHKYIKEPVRFNAVGELLDDMEDLFDMIGYPERSTQQRTFEDLPEPNAKRKEAVQVTTTDDLLRQSGDLATFVVHVKFRQHSTWQGEVVWAEKNKKCYFRSALELLKLIDGALDETESA